MLDLPNWLLTIFERERFSCPACAGDFDPTNITVVGIKNIDHKTSGNKEMLYIEYLCKKCGHRIGYEICNMNLRELGNTLNSEENQTSTEIKIQNPHPDEFKKSLKERSKSKISTEEKRQAIQSMKECDTFHDWLVRINAPINEMGKSFHMR